MKKTIRIAVAATAAVAGFTFIGSGSASAAHCLETVPDGVQATSPGFSYFGTDHVAEEEAHGGSPEGGNPGPHMGTSGASNCRDTTGSPSNRAPGQAKRP